MHLLLMGKANNEIFINLRTYNLLKLIEKLLNGYLAEILSKTLLKMFKPGLHLIWYDVFLNRSSKMSCCLLSNIACTKVA